MSRESQVKFIWLVLNANGEPDLNMDEISKELDLKIGATRKRWSRLKLAMRDGKPPAPSSEEFLWLCLKHRVDPGTPNWNDIAVQCGATPGASAKRFSRLKADIKAGKPPPQNSEIANATATTTKSPQQNQKKRTSKATSVKQEHDADDGVGDKSEEAEGMSPKMIPKRKRTPKKTIMNTAVPMKEEGDNMDGGIEEDVDYDRFPVQSKRRKITATATTSITKPEPVEETDVFGTVLTTDPDVEPNGLVSVPAQHH